RRCRGPRRCRSTAATKPGHYRQPPGSERTACANDADRVSLPIKIISTDFDGTFFAEFENPPVPYELQRLIGRLQEAGARWVINTGRDLSSLLEALARAHLRVRPDFLVVVEREIYVHEKAQYLGLEDWNRACAQDRKSTRLNSSQIRSRMPSSA